MAKYNTNQKIILFVFILIMLFATFSIAFAYFESFSNFSGELVFNTTTGGKTFTFTAYSNSEINLKVNKSDMNQNNVSENVSKSATTEVTVDLSSTDENAIACTYDLVWVWDSAEKYLLPTTGTLPYKDETGKEYPYEFSLVVDDKDEINISNLVWEPEGGEENKIAYIARNLRISATKDTPKQIKHSIKVNIYNIPFDQDALFEKKFLSHLEIRNNTCSVLKGPDIIDIEVTAKTSNSIDIKVVTDEQENEKLSYYYKKSTDEEFILLKEDTPDKTASFTKLVQDTDYDIKVVGANEYGSNEKIITVRTEVLEETAIRLKNDINWTGNGDASIELESDNTSLSIKYKVNGEENWHDYTGPIEGLHHADVVTAILTDGTNETGETSFTIEDKETPGINLSITQTSALQGHPLPFTVTNSDEESGINLSETKWYLDNTEGKVGFDSEKWNTATPFNTESETLNLQPEDAGIYYIHIIAVDNAGNKTEQVFGQLTFTEAVAETGGVTYNSIRSAFNAVPANGVETKVNLLKDVQENGISTVTNQNIVLDLNTHTVDGTYRDSVSIRNVENATLTITNGTVKANNNVVAYNFGLLNLTPTVTLTNVGIAEGSTNVSYITVFNESTGVANINGSTLISEKATVIYNTNEMHIENANISSPSYGAIYNIKDLSLTNTTISSGTVAIRNDATGTVNISGGNYSAPGNVLDNRGGSIIINDNASLNSLSTAYPAITNITGSSLIMTSGEIRKVGDAEAIQNQGSMELTDVTIKLNDNGGIKVFDGSETKLKGTTHIMSEVLPENTTSNANTIQSESGAILRIMDQTIVEGASGNAIFNEGDCYISGTANIVGKKDSKATILNGNASLTIGGTSDAGPTIYHVDGNTLYNYGAVSFNGKATFHNNDGSTAYFTVVNKEGGTINFDNPLVSINSNVGTLLLVDGGEVTFSDGTFTSTSGSGLRLNNGKLVLNGGTFSSLKSTVYLTGGIAEIHGGSFTTTGEGNALNIATDNSFLTPIDGGEFISNSTYPTVYVGNPALETGTSPWVEITRATIRNNAGNAIQNNGNILVRDNVSLSSATDYDVFVNYNLGEIRDMSISSKYNRAINNIGTLSLNNVDVLDGNADSITVTGLTIINNSGTLNINDETTLQGLNGNALYSTGTVNINDDVTIVGRASNYPTVYISSGSLNITNTSGTRGADISNIDGNALVNSGTSTISGGAKIYNTGDAESGAMALANQGTMTIDGASITSVNCVALYNASVPSDDSDTLIVKGTTTIASQSSYGSFRTVKNSRTNVQGNVTITGTGTNAMALYNFGIITMNGTGITVRSTKTNAFVNEIDATANLTGITIDNDGLDSSGSNSAPAYVNAGTTTANNVKFISNYTALYNAQGTVTTTGGSIVSRNNSTYYAIINASGATTTTNGTTITSYRLDQ